MEEKEPTTRENPSVDDSATVLHGQRPATHIAPGRKVGHYTILEVLGEGGFAVVYLAEQTEPVRRRVALKVIKLGMDTKQVLARFEAERQALAMMDHPCVAKVFDAGVTDDGRSYFVMEHVPGVPITDHCDRQRLNIEQRLALFTQVCDAVQHAHQKGIIHRDLKPTNVLVSAKEGSAVPKVIDFGVAKALHQKLTEKTLFTEQGQLIGTPEYMSPEQAEMTAQDIDTRSDIYSLGVLLYELLTGALPFDPKSLRKAAFAEIQRIIRQEEPPKPSTKLSSLGDASTTNADNRRLDPRSLMRELRGDLDWIVMKALEKDRERRYETANSLAMDLRRHLTHEPVLAGPPSATYKLRKFVRRNRTGVFAAGVVLGVLILGVAGTTWGWVEAIDARDAERDAKTRAQTDREIAQTVNDFLNDDLLAAVAPSAEEGRGKDVLMRDVLDVAAERIEEASTPGGRFEDKPLIEASIRQTLGVTYWKLGEYPAAQPHLERARELRRRVLGDDHPDTLTSMYNLALVYWYQGRSGEAEPLLVGNLEMRRRVLGEGHPDTLISMNNLGGLYSDQGRYDEAERLIVKALEMQRRMLGDEHPDTLSSMDHLAMVYEAQGRYDEAEPLYVEALETQRRVLGEEHPPTLHAMNSLALLYWNQGRYDEAERLDVEALETYRRVLGEEHPDTLTFINNLALVYLDQGRYDEAEPLFLETFEIRKRVLGEEHPNTLTSMNNLGELYRYQGRYDEAEPLYRQNLEILRKRVRGEEDTSTLMPMNNLALLLSAQGRLSEAEPLYREGVDTARRVLGNEDPKTIVNINNLAWHLQATGKSAEAEVLFREALELARGVFGEEHPKTLATMNNLGILVQNLGRFGEAEQLFRKALETSRNRLGEEHPDTVNYLNSLAVLLQKMGKLADAEPLLRNVVETRRRVLGEEHPSTLIAMSNFGWQLWKQGDLAEAESLFIKTIELGHRVRGEDHPDTLYTMNHYAGLLRDADRPAEAATLYSQILDGRRRALGDEHPLTPAIASSLVMLGMTLVEQDKHAEAEPLLRECLEIRHKALPEGHWLIANTMSVLGGSLAGQGKYVDAEPLLVGGYNAMKDNPQALDVRKREALERILDLYEAWGKPDEAAEWRAKLPDEVNSNEQDD